MSVHDRSTVDRIFNDPDQSESEEIIDMNRSADQLDESLHGLSQNHLIFSKLLDAANGIRTLTPEDADQIIAVICKNMQSGGTFRLREETTAAIVDLLGSTAESCDGALLKYLTTNYARLDHQHQHERDIDSNNHQMTPTSANKRRTSETLQPLCREMVALLERLHEWDFNVFALEQYTKSYLRVVTMTCMAELNLLDQIDFDEPKLESFLNEIDKSYQKNPYHNSMHAADVVQTLFHFCTRGRLITASGMNKISTSALIIAAAIHDVNHMGLTNHFLVSTDDPLAIQYNDHSPLENLHLATAFSILNTPSNNFMDRLSPSTRKDIRRLIIAIVLATDNDRHFSLHESLESIVNQREKALSPISQMMSRTNRLSYGANCCVFDDIPAENTLIPTNFDFKRHRGGSAPSAFGSKIMEKISDVIFSPRAKGSNRRKSLPSRRPSEDLLKAVNEPPLGEFMVSEFTEPSLRFPSDIIESILSDTDQLILLESVLHIADVSNPAKPWKVYCLWLDRVMAEFYDQGVNISHCIAQLDHNSNRWLYLAGVDDEIKSREETDDT